MNRNARIATCPFCGTRHSKNYLCEAHFESWQIDYELHEKQDWAGLESLTIRRSSSGRTVVAKGSTSSARPTS